MQIYNLTLIRSAVLQWDIVLKNSSNSPVLCSVQNRSRCVCRQYKWEDAGWQSCYIAVSGH